MVIPKIITATATGEETGFLDENAVLDLDIGATNDFELVIAQQDLDKNRIWYDFQIYAPGTEYGGLIEDIEVVTQEEKIYFRGFTWRGLLTQKIVEPPAGHDYLVLNGELNTVLGELIGNRFGSLFAVESADTGMIVNNWQVDRYVTVYAAITKLLGSFGYRLQISYQQGNDVEPGAVHLCAVPVKDWSDDLEYSQDNRLNFRVRDYRKGINHLICLGSGELKDRLVRHLYVQSDGSIGTVPCFIGLSERTAIYDFSSEAESEKLINSGTEKLKELRNYKKIELAIDDMDVEIGDIVGGRERVTGVYLKKPVVQKILQLSGGTVTIDYKVKGDD